MKYHPNTHPNRLRFEEAGWDGNTTVLRITHAHEVETKTHGKFTIPEGTLTDGASIPRMFWPVLGPQGRYFHAAVLHDYLYSKANTKIDRATADAIFEEVMEIDGVPGWQRFTIVVAVRAFGWRAWNKNRRV